MSETYFDPAPTGRITTEQITDTLRGVTLTVETVSGVFSVKRIDRGTQVLIDYAHIEPNMVVLDLGCGYGPVGLFLKAAYPSLKVEGVDVNIRAVKYARKNAKKLGLDVHFHVSDAYTTVKTTYDCILLNPPHSAGKAFCSQLLTDAKKYLTDDGYLQIVARKNKGGNELKKVMEQVYGNVEVLAKKSGFWVYSSQKK